MVVASSMHVDKGFFNGKGGFEYPFVLGGALPRSPSLARADCHSTMPLAIA